ncbi:MAG: pyridoxal-dependent decarboxylase [Steroidobacteraceae bacterium]
MNELMQDAARRAQRYLAQLGERPVRPDPRATAELARLEFPLPDAGRAPADVLALLDAAVGPATMASAGPRFFGFVIGGSLPAALAANWLAAAWDQNAGLHVSTPGVSQLERVSLGWLVELLGLPAGTIGGFVTGATMANFTALAAARHAVLERAGWAVEADGLFGAPPITVLVGEEAHPTLLKSLGLLGLGRARVRRVAVDVQGRMRPDALPPISGPTILCLQAGNVNTGAFDPLDALCPPARAAGAWIHVDGAFGLWAAASPALRHHVRGLELADSGRPMRTSGSTCRTTPASPSCATRMPCRPRWRSAPNTCRRTPPSAFPRTTRRSSRRARGVEVWAALLALGRAGVAELVERNCRQARRFAAGLSAAGHEILNEVVLNQVLVSFGTPEHTLRTIARLQEDGTCWAGSTVWQGRTAMRISVCGWNTTDADVERSLAAMLRAARG